MNPVRVQGKRQDAMNMNSERIDSEASEERFQILETKVLYQDRTIDDLNEVVTKQQDQIDLLIAEVERLRQALIGIQEREVDGGEEPPPPHY
jgi:SlyX protein